MFTPIAPRSLTTNMFAKFRMIALAHGTASEKKKAMLPDLYIAWYARGPSDTTDQVYILGQTSRDQLGEGHSGSKAKHFHRKYPTHSEDENKKSTCKLAAQLHYGTPQTSYKFLTT